MTLDEIYTHFNQNWAEVARELKIGTTTLQNWQRKGFIPIVSQIKIDERSDGLFVARIEDAKPQE